MTVGGKTQAKEFRKKDQVAAELVYFSDCVLEGKEPEPSGMEGLRRRAHHPRHLRIGPDRQARFRGEGGESGKGPPGDMEINLPPSQEPELVPRGQAHAGLSPRSG